MSWVCLMYHDVAPVAQGAGGGPERFTVSRPSFELMLDAILAEGYVGVSLSDALQAGDRPTVGITFDDGTIGQFEHAVPALRARDMTATFFVTTNWVGAPGFMTWDQLRQLIGWGMSVQSHTKSHPHLSELGHDPLQMELAESKAMLDRELRQNTNQIALPGGNAPRRRLRHLLADAGYSVVATSRWGHNRLERVGWIRRCTVPQRLSPHLAKSIVKGDVRLALARYPREATLNGLRALLGASRYARWRRRVLDALARGTS